MSNKSNLQRSFVTAIIVLLVLLPIAIPNIIAQEKYEWLSKTPMPTSRYNFGLAVVDGRIFAIGGTGSEGKTTLATNEMYDPQTDTWTTKTQMPTPRSKFAIATYQNKIYSIGGSNTFANEVYNPQTDKWESKASLPTQYNRNFLNAHTVKDKIYVISGKTNKFSMYSPNSPEVNIYDPKTDTWTQGTQIPHPVCKYASTLVNDKIYVFGGIDYTPPINVYNYTQIYDTTTDTWSFGTPIPENLYDCESSATSGDVTPKGIYVLGGVINETPSYVTQIYSPEEDRWTFGTSFPKFFSGGFANMNVSLSYPSGVVTVDDVLYAISGTKTLKYVPVESETPSPSITPTPTPTLEAFPTTIAVVSIATIAVVGIGIFAYWKKYRK